MKANEKQGADIAQVWKGNATDSTCGSGGCPGLNAGFQIATNRLPMCKGARFDGSMLIAAGQGQVSITP